MICLLAGVYASPPVVARLTPCTHSCCLLTAAVFSLVTEFSQYGSTDAGDLPPGNPSDQDYFPGLRSIETVDQHSLFGRGMGTARLEYSEFSPCQAVRPVHCPGIVFN